MDAVLMDIDGVLTVSWRPLPGAVAAVSRMRAAGLRIALLTNTTSRTRAAIAGVLAEAGFPVGAGDVLTAPALAAGYIAERYPGARCLLLNSGDIRADLAGVTLVGDHPDIVLIGGAGPPGSRRIRRADGRRRPGGGRAGGAADRNHRGAGQDRQVPAQDVARGQRDARSRGGLHCRRARHAARRPVRRARLPARGSGQGRALLLRPPIRSDPSADEPAGGPAWARSRAADGAGAAAGSRPPAARAGGLPMNMFSSICSVTPGLAA